MKIFFWDITSQNNQSLKTSMNRLVPEHESDVGKTPRITLNDWYLKQWFLTCQRYFREEVQRVPYFLKNLNFHVI